MRSILVIIAIVLVFGPTDVDATGAEARVADLGAVEGDTSLGEAADEGDAGPQLTFAAMQRKVAELVRQAHRVRHSIRNASKARQAAVVQVRSDLFGTLPFKFQVQQQLARLVNMAYAIRVLPNHRSPTVVQAKKHLDAAAVRLQKLVSAMFLPVALAVSSFGL